MKKLLLYSTMFFAFGANAQLRLVHDMTTELSSVNSDVCLYFTIDNKIYYSGIHQSTGRRYIYTTNGTNHNALIDVTSGNSSVFTNQTSMVGTSLEHNGTMYFTGMYPGIPYVRKTIPSGNTNYIFNLGTNSNNQNARLGYPAIVNDKLIFSHINHQTSGTAYGDEPFFVDLTNYANSGVLLDIVPGTFGSLPRYFTTLGANCFFTANDGVNGIELWKTDGTPTGTSLFQDINSGAGDSSPDQLNVLGTQLTFAATHATLGRELFKSNGNTGSLILIRDINTTGDSNPTSITNVGGELYFSANNGSIGQELWKSNGLNSGTILVKDINPTGDSNASKFKKIGTTVYFVANDGTNGIELWKTDGTNAGTVLVKNINPTGNSNPNYLTEYNGKLYFSADNGTNGIELWVSDGTTVGTTMIEINPTSSSTISQLMVMGNELYFAAEVTATIGKELYAYMDPALANSTFKTTQNSISIYPNPAKDYFEISSDVEVNSVEVYSIQGQLLKTYPAQSYYDVKEFTSGMYILKVKTAQSVVSKTLLVE